MDPAFSASRDRQRGLAKARDSLLVCAPPTAQTPPAGGWAEGAVVLAGRGPRLSSAGDPAGRPLQARAASLLPEGGGSSSPGPPAPRPLAPPPLTANPLMPHLPARPHACREAPAREGRGCSQISRQMAGGLGPRPGPALAQRLLLQKASPACPHGGSPRPQAPGPCPPAPLSLLRLHTTLH